MAARLIALLYLLAHTTEASLAPRSLGSSKKLLLPVQPTDSKDAHLVLRGGAVDPKAVAEVATCVSFVHGTMSYLCPAATNNVYGYEASPLTTLLSRRIGLALLSMGLLGTTVISGATMDSALVWLSLFWTAETLSTSVNQEIEAMGGSSSSNSVFAGMLALFLWGLTSKWAPLVTKLVCAFTLVNGLSLIAMPTSSITWWKFPDTDDDETAAYMMRDLGFWFAAMGVWITATSLGVDPVKAMAYSRLVVLARSLINIGLNGGLQSLKKPMQVGWLVYHLLIAGAMVWATWS